MKPSKYHRWEKNFGNRLNKEGLHFIFLISLAGWPEAGPAGQRSHMYFERVNRVNTFLKKIKQLKK